MLERGHADSWLQQRVVSFKEAAMNTCTAHADGCCWTTHKLSKCWWVSLLGLFLISSLLDMKHWLKAVANLSQTSKTSKTAVWMLCIGCGERAPELWAGRGQNGVKDEKHVVTRQGQGRVQACTMPCMHLCKDLVKIYARTCRMQREMERGERRKKRSWWLGPSNLEREREIIDWAWGRNCRTRDIEDHVRVYTARQRKRLSLRKQRSVATWRRSSMSSPLAVPTFRTNRCIEQMRSSSSLLFVLCWAAENRVRAYWLNVVEIRAWKGRGLALDGWMNTSWLQRPAYTYDHTTAITAADLDILYNAVALANNLLVADLFIIHARLCKPKNKLSCTAVFSFANFLSRMQRDFDCTCRFVERFFLAFSPPLTVSPAARPPVHAKTYKVRPAA